MSTVDITRANLEATVTGNAIVLLDFWASWCGPCRAFLPVFEQAATEHEDIVFGRVDTEAEQALAAEFQITSIPTLMAFRDGILVFAQPGALGGTALGQLITDIRGLDMDAVRAQLAAQAAGSEATR